MPIFKIPGKITTNGYLVIEADNVGEAYKKLSDDTENGDWEEDDGNAQTQCVVVDADYVEEMTFVEDEHREWNEYEWQDGEFEFVQAILS